MCRIDAYGSKSEVLHATRMLRVNALVDQRAARIWITRKFAQILGNEFCKIRGIGAARDPKSLECNDCCECPLPKDSLVDGETLTKFLQVRDK